MRVHLHGTGSIALGAIIGWAGFPAAYGTAAAVAVLSVPAFLLLDRRAFFATHA